MDNVRGMKRKPFSISDVGVFELEDRPEPMNQMKGELYEVTVHNGLVF